MKAMPYTTYLPTEVSWLTAIPEGWDQIRGRFLMTVNPPAHRARQLDETEEVSFVPMEAVGEYGGLNLERTKTIDEIGAGYTAFEEGDVVVAKITPCFENGKGALAQGLKNGVGFGTTELHVLRAGSRLDKQFLFYLTISQAFRALGESEMYGAGGQKRVPPEFAKDFRVPLPPLEAQRTIARFLYAKTVQIDGLVAQKRQLVDKLKEKRQALIARTVTRGLPPEVAKAVGLEPSPAMKDSGIQWLGRIPAHWKITELKYATSKIVDCPHETPVYDSFGAYCVVRTADIGSGTLDLSRAYRVDESEYLRRIRRAAVLPHDVLYGREGERWGFAAIAPAKITVCLGQRMMQFRAGARMDPRFLMWHLNARCVYEQGALDTTGSTAPHVNVETIRNYQLVEPPLAEQEAIAKFIDDQAAELDSLVEQVLDAIGRLTEYRQALITSAITGQIDVRSLVPEPSTGGPRHALAALS